jgi:DNA repair protein RecN (Recombination protein N)
MLTNLLIRNYALIEKLEFGPSQHLNIITGETGAGKSIMLGAIGMLMGNRADTKVLFDQEQKCIIEGTFHIEEYAIQPLFEEEDIDYETSCLIRREISPNGKSRAFINDTPVTLDTLKRIGLRLMDIHSQHDTMQLGSNTYQINLVDLYAQNHESIRYYQEIYTKYKYTEKKYNNATTEASQAKKELDFNNFLLQELLESKLRPHEQEELESELEVLENAEEIKTKLSQASQALQDGEPSSITMLTTACSLLDKVSRYAERFQQYNERLQSALIEIKDIASEVSAEGENVELNMARIEEAQNRLSLIFTLQKKHQVSTIEELIVIQNNLEEKVNRVTNLDDEILELKNQLDQLGKELKHRATLLTETRTSVLTALEAEIVSLLSELGIPNATMKIRHQVGEYTSNGVDTVQFLFSANKGVAPQDLKNAASGGEFSRLMFSIKYLLADKTALPTIIFDEIDTGISGEIAIKLGTMMKQMARNHQLITITHLPQVAATGEAHYFVYKDNSSTRTISKIRQLSTEERIYEIAQMISGAPPSSTSLQNAKELLESSLMKEF